MIHHTLLKQTRHLALTRHTKIHALSVVNASVLHIRNYAGALSCNVNANFLEPAPTILQLSRQGLSDYRIARKINTDPPSVTRSRKNARKKLLDAVADLEWATRIGLSVSEFYGLARSYSFFL